MPELPEVETVTRGLREKLEGRTIRRIDVRREGLRYPFPPNMAALLENQTFVRLYRRAKFALADLSNQHTLLLHLGMSGRVVFASNNEPLAKHDHLVFTLDNGLQLRFNDPRRFGVVDVLPTKQMLSSKHFANMGVEPLEAAFSATYLHAALKKRSTPIKPTLMDSKLVVGVGNIYASEALFRAGIRPTTASNKLSLARVTLLVGYIQQVLTEAIAAGGTSLRDYVQTDGTLGYFQHNFRVYGRDGQLCHTCGAKISKIQQAGRSTYFCPACQK